MHKCATADLGNFAYREKASVMSLDEKGMFVIPLEAGKGFKFQNRRLGVLISILR